MIRAVLWSLPFLAPALALAQLQPAEHGLGVNLAARESVVTGVLDSLYTRFEAENALRTRLRLLPPTEAYARFQPDEVPTYAPEVVAERLRLICGAVPLDYNEYVQRFIDMYVFRRRELLGRMLGLQQVYFPTIEEVFDREGLPMELKYLAVIESALNPTAKSWAGATGLWQFMTGTGQMEGLQVTSVLDERRDPVRATEAAARHLKRLYGIYNDWLLVIAAYNCGPGRVNWAIQKAGGKADIWKIYDYLPYETRGYVPSFIAAMYAMHYPVEHNIRPYAADFTYDTDTLHITRREVWLDDLALTTGANPQDLYALNPELRLGKVPFRNETYVLRITPAVRAWADAHPGKLWEVAPAQTLPPTFTLDRTIPSGARLTMHTVRTGQSYTSLAQEYEVTPNQLMGWNGATTTRLEAGQQLKVYVKGSRYSRYNPAPRVTTPPPNGKYHTYTVQPGDTLWDIAQRYPGVDASAIQAANGLANSRIQVGQTLRIPAAGK